MSDMTSDRSVPRSRPRQPGKGEYGFYFVLILICAVPFALLLWTLGTLRITRAPDRGPLAMAIEQANIVTPKIFWA